MNANEIDLKREKKFQKYMSHCRAMLRVLEWFHGGLLQVMIQKNEKMKEKNNNKN